MKIVARRHVGCQYRLAPSFRSWRSKSCEPSAVFSSPIRKDRVGGIGNDWLDRLWYYHYKQAADLPEMARLHGAVARAIVDGAGRALDRLLDNMEAFTRATITEL